MRAAIRTMLVGCIGLCVWIVVSGTETGAKRTVGILPVGAPTTIPAEFASTRVYLHGEDPTVAAIVEAICTATGWTIDRHEWAPDEKRPDRMRVPAWVEGATAADVICQLANPGEMDAYTDGVRFEFREHRTMTVGHVVPMSQRSMVCSYDIRSLLHRVRAFEAHRFALDNGGSGSAASFVRGLSGIAPDDVSDSEFAEDLIDVLVAMVTPDHWEYHGGLSARVSYESGSLIITAPQWIHGETEAFLNALYEAIK